jgi:extracellular elastinolytic metalloproteinase
MGEGWGDFFATILRMKPEYNRTINFDMGSYANGGNGIRKYKYSTSMKMNPETYGVMDNPGYWGVHAKGAVWAEILYEVYWNLVDKLGFTPDWYSASKDHGNTLMFQLVVDGMKFQPCRPSFLDARDAILQAEKQLTKGAHSCELWKGFAKRGLGLGAETGGIFQGRPRKESYKTPPSCT